MNKVKRWGAMRFITLVMVSLLVSAATCSVKQSVDGLNQLKDDCANLELDLAGLKATKWTEVIDAKVEQCSQHGFWDANKFKPKRKKLTPIDLDFD